MQLLETMTSRTIFALGVVLTSSLTPSDLPRPQNLMVGSQEISGLIDSVGACIDRHPQWHWEAAYEKRQIRFLEASDRYVEIWGADQVPLSFDESFPSMPCRKSDVTAALGQIDKRLDALDLAFANATKGIETGVWAGSIKICRERVDDVSLIVDEQSQQTELLVKLKPQAGAAFAALTRQSINRRLAIRIDGMIILRPTIYEAIESGEVQISGPDVAVLKRFAEKIRENGC
jgi:hypothetical protein